MSQAKTLLNTIKALNAAKNVGEGIANIEDPQDVAVMGALTKLKAISSMTHVPLLTFASDLGLEFFSLVKEGHWDKMSTVERIGWVTGHVVTDTIGSIIPGADTVLDMGADWVKEHLGIDLQDTFEDMAGWFEEVFTGEKPSKTYTPKITNPAYFMNDKQRQAAARHFTKAHSKLQYLRKGVFDGNKSLADQINWLLDEASLRGMDAQELLTGRGNPLQSDWLAPKLLKNEDYSQSGFTEQSYNAYLKEHNVGQKLREWLYPDYSKPVITNVDQLQWFMRNYVHGQKPLDAVLEDMGLNNTHFIDPKLADSLGLSIHKPPAQATPMTPTSQPQQPPESEPEITPAPQPPTKRPRPPATEEEPITEHPRLKAMRIRDFA